jgi:hypothetical protein
MLRFVRQATVVLLSLFVGCTDSTAPVSLGLNRARWESQDLHSYGFTMRRSCFCLHSGEDVWVAVMADTVASVSLLATGMELPKSAGYTVDGLFELAQRSYGEDHNTGVRVEYDRALGYPTLIDVVCSDIPDCGLRMEIRDLGGLVTIGMIGEDQ